MMSQGLHCWLDEMAFFCWACSSQHAEGVRASGFSATEVANKMPQPCTQVLSAAAGPRLKCVASTFVQANKLRGECYIKVPCKIATGPTSKQGCMCHVHLAHTCLAAGIQPKSMLVPATMTSQPTPEWREQMRGHINALCGNSRAADAFEDAHLDCMFKNSVRSDLTLEAASHEVCLHSAQHA